MYNVSQYLVAEGIEKTADISTYFLSKLRIASRFVGVMRVAWLGVKMPGTDRAWLSSSSPSSSSLSLNPTNLTPFLFSFTLTFFRRVFLLPTLSSSYFPNLNNIHIFMHANYNSSNK